MESQTSSATLDTLIADAKAIAARRRTMLEKISRTEAEIAQSEQQLGAAQARINTEEFEAAQQEGGLAIASVSAQEAVRKAELLVRSRRLRLQGLSAERDRIEAELLTAVQEFEAHRDRFLLETIEETQRRFDAAIPPILDLLRIYVVLERYCGANAGEKYGFRMLWMSRLNIFDPTNANGAEIRGAANAGCSFSRIGGRKGIVHEDWRNGAEARQLDEAIRSMADQIAAIRSELGSGNAGNASE